MSERLGVDAALIRLAFALIALNAGIGVALYFALYALTVPADEVEQKIQPRPTTDRHNLGFFLMVLALLCASRSTGIWIGDNIMWPALFVAIGSAIIVLRNDSDTQRWESNRLASVFGSRPSRLRLAAGTVAVAAGVGIFLAANSGATGNQQTLLAVAATALGMLLIFGPWLSRLGRQLIDERSNSIRTQERAEVGAHLHDSVLQTLAMIQRADSAEQMTSLARQQERDLQAWLHGKSTDENASIQAALEALAARIDSDFQVATTVIVVGDQPVTENLRPLLAATQEAVTNAARHSGAANIHVYVEISEERATALVRDEGSGFDIGSIADDRQGLKESIRGRMQRHGGEAKIHSQIGTGTEVELSLPLQKREW